MKPLTPAPDRHILLARAVTVLLGASTVVHGLVISGAIHFRYVGGGRYPDERTALIGESMAIASTAVLALLSASRGGWLRPLPRKVLIPAEWVAAALFALNTVGNLAAQTMWEKAIATPLTGFLAVAFAVLAIRDTRARR